MPLETYYVFEDAKSSFVYGNYVATIVLAAAFVEHWLSAGLARRGYEKEASRGLAASIKTARTKALVHPFLLDKVERLRLIRNAFVHFKSLEDQHILTQRSFRQGADPKAVLGIDAQDALVAMYGVAAYAFGRG